MESSILQQNDRSDKKTWLMNNFEWIGKSLIGILGTTLSVLLENVSLFLSAIAAAGTAWYMISQAIKAHRRMNWELEDRNHEVEQRDQENE